MRVDANLPGTFALIVKFTPDLIVSEILRFDKIFDRENLGQGNGVQQSPLAIVPFDGEYQRL